MKASGAIFPWKPFLVLALSLSLTLTAVYGSFASAQAKDLARFENRTQRTEDLIRSRIDAYVVLLRAAGYFFASNTPGSIRSEDVRSFVERLDLTRSHPAIVRIGFSRKVLAGEDEAFAAALRASGGPDFRIRPPGDRPLRFPLVLLEPHGEDETLLGFDLFSDPRVGEAMRRAGESGEPVASDPLGAAAEEPATALAGYLVSVPVYRSGRVPKDPAARQAALEGFVHGVFRLDALLGGLYSGSVHPGIAFEVRAGGPEATGPLLYRAERMPQAPARPEFSQSSTLKVAGHPWTIRYASVPPFGEGSTQVPAVMVLLLGLASSGALFWAAWSQHEATVKLRRSEEDIRRLNLDLERRVESRTAELQAANRELEAFSYSVSHDLRGPLRSLDGFSQLLMDHYAERLDHRGRDYLRRVLMAVVEMDVLIDGFLKLARVTRQEMKSDRVDLSEAAEAVARDLRSREPGRSVTFRIEPGIAAKGDAQLLRVVVENLLGNAWKFTSRRSEATIEFGRTWRNGAACCYVRDDGAGFDMAHAARLFTPFERLHAAAEFPGSGVGLATVRRVLERHGGTIEAEAAPDRGAAFFFTLPGLQEPAASPATEEVRA